MVFDGCQGKKSPEIIEKTCPNCGATVEMMTTDVSCECEECGYMIFGDLMSCAYRCANARDCVGEVQYGRLLAAKEEWEARMKAQQDDDEW